MKTIREIKTPLDVDELDWLSTLMYSYMIDTNASGPAPEPAQLGYFTIDFALEAVRHCKKAMENDPKFTKILGKTIALENRLMEGE
jgi:hypothetical protein